MRGARPPPARLALLAALAAAALPEPARAIPPLTPGTAGATVELLTGEREERERGAGRAWFF